MTQGPASRTVLHTALLMIDMQNGFIDTGSSLCIAGAKDSICACKAVLEMARAQKMPIMHVRREYASDGSDVEPVRKRIWEKGGKPLSAAWPESLAAPHELTPHADEPVLIKPRFSAFFQTSLHSWLQERNIASLILIGTTTPNCIRSTCYDALSLNYDVVVVSDATSSRSEEVQRANLEDMAFIGATVCTTAELAHLLRPTE